MLFLNTEWSRNLFYFGYLPAFLLLTGWRRARLAARTPIARLAALYMGYTVLSIAWTDGLDLARAADSARLFVLAGFFYVSATALLAARPGLEPEFWRWFAASAIVALAISITLAWEALIAGHRFSAIGRGENEIRAAILFGVALLATLFAILPETERRWPKALWAAGAGALLAGVLLTGSRGPVLALVLGVAAALFVGRRRYALTAAAVLTAIAILLFAFDIIDIHSWIDRGASWRIVIWHSAVDYFTQRPILGHGFGHDLPFGAAGVHEWSSPHNVLLGQLVAGGIVGLALFLALLGAMALEVWRGRHEPRGAFFLGLLVFAGAAGLTNFHMVIINLDVEWLMFWAPAAMLTARQARRIGG